METATMPQPPFRPDKAYKNMRFLNSRDARTIRLLAEYLEPERRFKRYKVQDTIVFFGSARAVPPEEAPAESETATRLARYYRDAEELACRLTEWSKGLPGRRRRFLITSGGGPGIMEAANRGAARAKGVTVGLGISLPDEPSTNPFVSRELAFEFHYFFTRKFWFLYLAKAIVVFPGGFGTLDELFEVLTLLQTKKLARELPVVLYGREYWDAIVDFAALERWGVVSPDDLERVRVVDSVDEASQYLRETLTTIHGLDGRAESARAPPSR